MWDEKRVSSRLEPWRTCRLDQLSYPVKVWKIADLTVITSSSRKQVGHSQGGLLYPDIFIREMTWHRLSGTSNNNSSSGQLFSSWGRERTRKDEIGFKFNLKNFNKFKLKARTPTTRSQVIRVRIILFFKVPCAFELALKNESLS